jgi:hypothetical protein
LTNNSFQEPFSEEIFRSLKGAAILLTAPRHENLEILLKRNKKTPKGLLSHFSNHQGVVMSRTSLYCNLSVTALVAAATLATSCKMKSEESDTLAAGNLPFATFCKSFQLSKCNVSPQDVNMKQRDWELGIDIFKEFLNSASSVKVTREELNQGSIRDVFTTFGAQNLMAFVKSIPWATMETDVSGIVLTGTSATQSVKINELTFIAQKKVSLKVNRTRSFSVSGLSIADASGKNEQKVLSIDLSNAGRLHFTTDKLRITDFPISFFALDGMVQPVNLNASTVMKAITNLATDPSFDWRTKLTIVLKNSNLTKLLDISNEVMPDNTPFGSTLETVVRKAKNFVFGGTGNMLVAVSLDAPVKCIMKFVNIPLIGNKDIGLTFAASFGIENLRKTSATASMAKIYGITSGAGAVQSAEFVGNTVKVKVGGFTIPLDMDKQASGKGVQLRGITCQ